jgi:hypothetical protein
MWLPRGRGADPQVDTTVAKAIRAPFQARAAASTLSFSAITPRYRHIRRLTP